MAMGGPPGMGRGNRDFMSEEEKNSLPKVTTALLKRIFSYLAPYWKQLLLTLLCIVFSSIMTLMPSVLTGKIIDEGLIGKNFHALIFYIVLSLSVTAGGVYAELYETQFKGAVAEEEKEPEGPIGADSHGSYAGPRSVRKRSRESQPYFDEIWDSLDPMDYSQWWIYPQ